MPAASGDDVIAGIDVSDVSGNRLGGVADQERGVGADIVESYEPVLGRVADGAFQQLVEMVNSGSCAGLQQDQATAR